MTTERAPDSEVVMWVTAAPDGTIRSVEIGLRDIPPESETEAGAQ
jgi:hypothetical protein